MRFPNVDFKKVSLLFATLILTFALGSGMNQAFAGQGIQSLLTSWFDSKKEASIQQIDLEITSEKERLMAELKEVVSADIKRADAELAQFTEDEINSHVSQLQSYANELMKSLHFDNSEERAKIKANLDAAFAEAKSLIDNAVTAKPPTSPVGEGKGKGKGKEKGNGNNDNQGNNQGQDNAHISNTKENLKQENKLMKANKEHETTDSADTTNITTVNTEEDDEGSSSDSDNNSRD